MPPKGQWSDYVAKSIVGEDWPPNILVVRFWRQHIFVVKDQ